MKIERQIITEQILGKLVKYNKHKMWIIFLVYFQRFSDMQAAFDTSIDDERSRLAGIVRMALSTMSGRQFGAVQNRYSVPALLSFLLFSQKPQINLPVHLSLRK